MRLEQIAALVWRFLGILLIASLIFPAYRLISLHLLPQGLVGASDLPGFSASSLIPRISLFDVFWLSGQFVVGVLIVLYSSLLGERTARGL